MFKPVPDQLMLCKVDIYGTSTFWPKPSLINRQAGLAIHQKMYESHA